MTVNESNHPYHARRKFAAMLRWKEMLSLRRQGKTYSQIAIAYGVSLSMAFKCIAKAGAIENR